MLVLNGTVITNYSNLIQAVLTQEKERTEADNSTIQTELNYLSEQVSRLLQHEYEAINIFQDDI